MDSIMADSKNKKSSSVNTPAKKTVADKTEKKPASSASKAVSKTPTTTTAKSAAASTTTKAKADNKVETATKAEVTPSKTSSTNKANSSKASSTDKAVTSDKVENKSTAKTEKTTPAKAKTEKVTASTAPAKTSVKKEKRSGSGMAFLALLCSLVALGLSSYSFYEQKFSPQAKQSQDVLLSGVNDIKSNVNDIKSSVTEFGSAVSGVQKDVSDFKASQEQYITKDTLVSTVKESVDDAVKNLPDLPDIGPKEVEPETNSISTTAQDNAEQLDPAENSELAEQGDVIAPSTPTTDTENKETTDNTQADTTSETTTEPDDSTWSWNRAKKDLNEMFKGFIKIEKIDQK